MVGLPLASKFNEIIQLDVGEFENNKFLVIVDYAIRYTQAVWLKNKTSKEIIERLIENWITYFGSPNGIMSDVG